MNNFVLLALTVILAVAEGVCPSNERHYYESIGCVPQDTDKDGCVTSYDCSSVAGRRQDRCYYKGQEYPEGATLSSIDYYTCLDHCTCVNSTTHSRLLFECVRVDCPDLEPASPGSSCHLVYEHGKCCEVKKVCDNETESELGCRANRRIFKYGRRFYPDVRFHPEAEQCLACICNPEFNGTFVEPFCRKITCNLELVAAENLAKGCIPVFYGEKGCCPINWRCPNSTDTVIPSSQPSHSSTARTCQFGSLTMQVGDSLNVHPYVSGGGMVGLCSCRVPPHPICVYPDTGFEV